MIQTIKIEYTEAQTIRCVARRDIPEANIKEGQVIYLTRSSKNDGTYYIATWNYAEMRWDCRCPATKPCRHNKLISVDCSKPHSLQGFKPASKAEKFAALVQKYDVRYQAPAVIAQAERVAREADEKYRVSPELRKAGAFSILR